MGHARLAARALLTLSLLTSLPGAARGQAAKGPPLKVLGYETPGFFHRERGKPAGLEYELLEYYARSKGRPLQVIWVADFEQVLPRLIKGEGDVAAATLTATRERERQVDFSAPYFPVRVMLVEPRTQKTKSLAELAGATVATIKGTTYETLMATIPRAKMVYGKTEEDLLRLIAAGKARAAAADSALVLGPLRKYPQLHLGIALSPEQGLAFAVPKGSPLRDELSKHLAQLKAGQIYYRLLEKYLGSEAAKLAAAGRER